jgi:hypothetical protein
MSKMDMWTTTMAFNAFDRGSRTGAASGRFVVQAQHPDGHRWIDIRSFETKNDARAAIEHVVALGHGSADGFRIRKASSDEHE